MRPSRFAISVVVLAMLGLVHLESASAVVPTGTTVTITPPTCGNIVDTFLSNKSGATQTFDLLLSGVSTATRVSVPNNVSVTVRKRVTASGTAQLSVAGSVASSKSYTPNSCYGSDQLPELSSSSQTTSMIATKCGSQAVIATHIAAGVNNANIAISRGGAQIVSYTAPANDTTTVNMNINGSIPVSVKNGSTTLATQQVDVLDPCTANPVVNWGAPNMTDDFNGSSVDTSKWNIYNSPNTYPPRVPSQVSVGGGELKLGGVVDTALGRQVSGGVGNRTSQMYGHWEARFKYDKGQGFRSAILLWPENENWPTDGEIDFSEVFNGDRSIETEFQHNGIDNKFIGQAWHGDMTQWHTAGVDWTPDRITFYMDGQLAWNIPSINGNFNYVPSSGPMHLALQNDSNCFGICTDANTPAQVLLHIDWVKQWTYPVNVPRVAGVLSYWTNQGQNNANTCLDADANTRGANGTKVQIYQCLNANNQKWNVWSDGTIRSVAYSRCLDADNNQGGANGSRIQLWDCTGQPNQQWKFGVLENGVPRDLSFADWQKSTNPNKILRTGMTGNRCLDATLWTYNANGTPMQIWDCLDAGNQSWGKYVWTPATH